jgi:hypothetical protein
VQICTAFEKAADELRGRDIHVWESPSIAPPGFIDFCAGQTIFSVFGTDGKPTVEKIFYLTDGNHVQGFPIKLSDDVGSVMASAVEFFRASR